MPRARRPSVWAAKTAVCQLSIQPIYVFAVKEHVRPRPFWQSLPYVQRSVNGNPDFLQPCLQQHLPLLTNAQKYLRIRVPNRCIYLYSSWKCKPSELEETLRGERCVSSVSVQSRALSVSTKSTRTRTYTRKVRVMMANPRRIRHRFLSGYHQSNCWRPETSTREDGRRWEQSNKAPGPPPLSYPNSNGTQQIIIGRPFLILKRWCCVIARLFAYINEACCPISSGILDGVRTLL